MLAELLELAPGGVEERERRRRRRVRGLRRARRAARRCPTCARRPAARWSRCTTSEVADDWDERWKAFHQPGAGRRAAACARRGRRRARACSTSSSTPRRPSARARTRPRACASSCCSSSSPPGALVDVGCGSGVLAIAAARLGWGPVLGIDHERESVQATLDNAAANGVAVQARRHDLLRDGPAPGRADRPGQPAAPAAAARRRRRLRRPRARRARRQRPARARGRRGRRRLRRATACARPGAATAASGSRCCCGARVGR